jgi:hypothetical protein
LQDRLSNLKVDRDRARAALEATTSRHRADIRIDPALIESFGSTMRENLTTGSTPFRKAYLRALIDVIEVEIKGNKDVLERAVLASKSGTDLSSQMSTKWRARRNSNS